MISWTVLSFLASSFATFSKAAFILSKTHSVTFTSFLEVLLYSSHSPLFNAKKPCFIILCVQSVSLQHFTCSKYSLTGNFCCHWPYIPACLYFSASSQNLFTCRLSWQTYSPISRMYCSFHIIFHSLPRCVFFFTNSYHCSLCQWFVSFCLQRLVVTLLA